MPSRDSGIPRQAPQSRQTSPDADDKAAVALGVLLGLLHRLGINGIQLELMPAAPAERTRDNPWPEWPRTLRTDYGQIEAIAVQGADPRQFETTVQRIIPDESGRISEIEVVNVSRSADGRMLPGDGTQRRLSCQLLLIAAGFVGCEQETADLFNVNLNRRGVPDIYVGTHRIAPGLFTAGDMRSGQSLVVRAIADGRAAAIEVNQYLMGC